MGRKERNQSSLLDSPCHPIATEHREAKTSSQRLVVGVECIVKGWSCCYILNIWGVCVSNGLR